MAPRMNTARPSTEAHHVGARPHRDGACSRSSRRRGDRDQRQRRRHHQAGAETSHRLPRPQQMHRAAAVKDPGEPADEGARHCQRHADERDKARAVAVGKHAAGQDSAGEGDRECVSHPLQLVRTNPGACADGAEHPVDGRERQVADQHRRARERDSRPGGTATTADGHRRGDWTVDCGTPGGSDHVRKLISVY